MDIVRDFDNRVRHYGSPKSQAEVYAARGFFDYNSETEDRGRAWDTKFNKAVVEARQEGFRFFRFGHESGVYHAHPVGVDETANYVCYWSEIPEAKPQTGERSILEAVTAYLAAPERSERVAVQRELSERGFWRVTDDGERETILTELAESGRFCDEGVRRFREALADILKPEPALLYEGRDDLTKAVPVELLISDGASAARWLASVNTFLDQQAKHGTTAVPLARLRLNPES